jgi:hypothetical protein
MDTEPEFTLRDLLTHICGGVAKAVATRPGESEKHNYIRVQAAGLMVLAFSPRDSIEAMLAGRCVMLHEMIVDGVGKVMCPNEAATPPLTSAAIVSMDRAFGANLTRLERYQTRRAHSPERPYQLETLAEANIADRVRRHRGAPSGSSPDAARVTPRPVFTPTSEQIAACGANPEAMAALEAADPARFAHAMGVANPDPAYLAAAGAQMAELNRLAAGAQTGSQAASPPGSHQQMRPVPYKPNRQQRRHPNR